MTPAVEGALLGARLKRAIPLHGIGWINFSHGQTQRGLSLQGEGSGDSAPPTLQVQQAQKIVDCPLDGVHRGDGSPHERVLHQYCRSLSLSVTVFLQTERQVYNAAACLKSR
eukprot:CAMPEP_0194350400 /NCGR_PEP_ID=MMETSP0171-20130528/107621_1 /TAXON_ID=218684 /ORGANISM="Corethron pennatum, Strain L29A3" /LENGTH=111 /DNA_ID=CAMNT_0039117947 /DNA_START=791 /DNA_END=1123 /DNA_ORIENTATION=+